ncbi:MAG: 23S rRNA (adenine(2503)-C(2))-methyltransferase RlmN [Candidatus Firestonebacteria bacterium]|nr:23S rRNA (adenine(2503)-C(2))-methyltransferase RlmN [Candidatus Firestonebacteria bacterium]
MKKNIKEFYLEEMVDILDEWQKPKFHAKQIYSWIYKKMVSDFDLMSDIPIDLRNKLKEHFYIYDSKIIGVQNSKDGTAKYLFELNDNSIIEAVLIPSEKRVTACISTQVGCKYGCKFCASGLCGFKRDLTSGEIIEEIWQLKNNFLGNKLTNIVFMGIGEPLDNYENLLKAIKIINSEHGFDIGARRITISSCGIIPAIKKLSGEGMQIELSISLHAADDRTRSTLMPVNKKYPLKELIKTCDEYIKKTNRMITFEYILIKDINSDSQSAVNLSELLKNLKCKVNLIIYNPVKEIKFQPPDKSVIQNFCNYLFRSGINVTLRKSRGNNIDAACGQLKRY